MTDTLLAETLRDWSEEATVPRDLAARTLTRQRRVRRRRAIRTLGGLGLGVAAVAAAALLGSGPLGLIRTDDDRRGEEPVGPSPVEVQADTTHSPPEKVVTAGNVAVSAIVTYARVPASPEGWETLRRSYSVANVSSGRYEPASWSYLAVAPGLRTAAVLESPLPASRIGFVDLATDEVIRWVPTEHPVASVAWSPDGSRVLATAYDGDPDLQKPTGNNSYRLGDARRTGFVLVDAAEGPATFQSFPASGFAGRDDVGWSHDGTLIRAQDPVEGGGGFWDLNGQRAPDEDETSYNGNLGIAGAGLPTVSPDGRFSITEQSGLPTQITDLGTGETYRQQALQVLAWADDEHVITLAGCEAPCRGKSEFRNALVLMRYDGTDLVPLTAARKGDTDWSFELTPRCGVLELSGGCP